MSDDYGERAAQSPTRRAAFERRLKPRETFGIAERSEDGRWWRQAEGGMKAEEPFRLTDLDDSRITKLDRGRDGRRRRSRAGDTAGHLSEIELPSEVCFCPLIAKLRLRQLIGELSTRVNLNSNYAIAVVIRWKRTLMRTHIWLFNCLPGRKTIQRAILVRVHAHTFRISENLNDADNSVT
uniref:Uncharacterized protein n=1 Tax=Plectus sambesii TaxID=2011161 RepID=A0A914XJ05_9BILA